MQINSDKMRDARERAGLTRAQLAEKLGVSVPTVWRIEQAGQVPSANIAASWAVACRVALVRLYEAA